MIKRRIVRIFILVFSIFLAYLLYSTEYNIKPNMADIERAIEEFIESDIRILKIIEVDNTIAVNYDFGGNDRSGFTALYRGINFKYQIRSAGYGARNTVVKGVPFKTNKGDYIAVYGRNYNKNASSFKIKTYTNEVFTGKIDGVKDFLIPFKIKNETIIDNYYLYDDENNDITDEMKMYLTSNFSFGTSKGKAELFLLNVFCGIIILVGYLISNSFKDKKVN